MSSSWRGGTGGMYVVPLWIGIGGAGSPAGRAPFHAQRQELAASHQIEKQESSLPLVPAAKISAAQIGLRFSILSALGRHRSGRRPLAIALATGALLTTPKEMNAMRNKVLRYSILGSALLLCQVSCGGVTLFQGASVHSIVGTLPPPPPPKVEVPPPRVEIRDNKITISEKIQFDHNKATIKPESHSLLDEVVALIQNNPQLKKISIDGHASAEGTAVANKKLSDDRAKSVMAYLVGHGVEQARLSAKGWGIEKPISDNATEAGREKNRRVEFNIVEQDVTQRKVEIDPVTGKEKKVLDSSTQSVKAAETTAPVALPTEPKPKPPKLGPAPKKGEKK